MAKAPLDKNEKTLFVGFKLVESMAESMDDLASTLSMSRSLLIREALTEYIAAHAEEAAA